MRSYSYKGLLFVCRMQKTKIVHLNNQNSVIIASIQMPHQNLFFLSLHFPHRFYYHYRHT